MEIQRPLVPDDFEEFIQFGDKYGFCTFEQFCRNPEKWRDKKDDLFASADKGGTINKVAQKFFYEVCGYRTQRLEEVERIVRDEGLKVTDYKASILPGVGQKCDILIKFITEDKNAKKIIV